MPSVKASEEFDVSADQGRCWIFFSNLANIGLCIPGCESVIIIDSESARFRVRVKVGYLSRTFEMKARFRGLVPPTRLEFTAEGSDAEISGNLEISSPASAKTSRVKYAIEIRPISVIGKTALSMMGKDLVRKQVSEFASCVRSKLET